MCEFYDAAVPRQCREDGAEEVLDKERSNFCDWFKPCSDVFDAARANQESAAKDALSALFGKGETSTPGQDELQSEADDLFK
jgi:hypothetical protein